MDTNGEAGLVRFLPHLPVRRWIGRQRKRAADTLFEGVYVGDSRKHHLQAIRRLQPQGDDVFEHTYLYDCLSILDEKAAAVLSYNSLVLAASSLTLGISSDAITIGSIVGTAALLFSGVSAALALRVVWVHWTDTNELENSRELFVTLLEVRNRRTVWYRLSWVFAQASTPLLIASVILQRRL